MTGRRTIAGLCMLCALGLSVFAAQSASAASKGTTLFTCKKTGPGGGFTKAHCKASDAGSGEYSHVAISPETTTEITGTTENTEGVATPSKLESVQAGVAEQLESKLAHILPEVGGVKSWVKNRIDLETGEHYFHGEAWVLYTEVTVTKPAGKGCKVKGGQIQTNKLTFTSTGQGDEVKFEPAVAGEPFATFEVEGCTVAALNGKYEVKGSVKGQPDGATINFTHLNSTAQGTLSLRGQKAGFESSATIKGTEVPAGDAVDTPLSVTTVETP
jgi:hypothetical protein